jgi:hypothetical protein
MSPRQWIQVALVLIFLLLTPVYSVPWQKAPTRKPPGKASIPQPIQVAELADHHITESSGIVASRRNPGVYWTHNDSGARAEIFAFDMKGRALARFRVTGATHVDWEDIAAGGGAGDTAVLYIGDIGDNNRLRNDTAIYRVWEPEVDPEKTGQEGQTLLAEKYPFVYPDGHHDAETLLVDPKTEEIFIITKEESGVSGVYRFPMPLRRNHVVTLEKVTTVTFTNPFVFRGRAVGKLATGGDISPDGTHLVIRTYTDAYEWTIKPGEPLVETFKRKPKMILVPWMGSVAGGRFQIGQFEAICYTQNGQALLTTSEGAPCPLWKVPLPRK